MNPAVRVAVFSALAMAGLATAEPSTLSQIELRSAITGQVTVRGTPVRGASVWAGSSPPGGPQSKGQDKTDANGQYRIANLSPGRYIVMVSAPPLALPQSDQFGREVTLDRSETRDGIDFALAPGGVITGRVSESNGSPVIGERINVVRMSEQGPRPFPATSDSAVTDDRGVYRVYGIPPGRYKVSIGQGSGSFFRDLDRGGGYYPLTYHPGELEESKAKVIELGEGAEVSGIDILVGARRRTFEASGRLVDAETGQPQAGINWGYAGNSTSVFGSKSDEGGGFRITGLAPGRYSAFAGCEADYYSDGVEFEITDRDVAGLEIRRHRGASISGKVVIEGVTDPVVLSKVTQISLGARNKRDSTGADVGADGSFYFCGLRPGKIEISGGSWRQAGFHLQRIERNGADLSEGINVTPGDHITDVRLVFTYATGVIRGQIRTEGFEMPAGVRFQVQVHLVAGASDDPVLHSDRSIERFWADTDDRGRFVVEGLAPGEYGVSAGSSFLSSPGARIPTIVPTTQRITVENGAESQVTLVLKQREPVK